MRFINRNAEMALIDEALKALQNDEEQRLPTPIVNLYGVVGIGKTALLHHVGRYLFERAAVEALPIPTGWAFTDDQSHPCIPNVMQRRIAWMVRERKRIGNWSGTGTGKTLSARMASRTIDAQLTLVIVANPTIDQWQEQILNAYPDSIVCRELEPQRWGALKNVRPRRKIKWRTR